MGNGQRPDKMAPHSAEAEEAVLGSILINPDALAEVSGFLSADDFFIVRNAWVYEAMLALSEQRLAIDYLTVIEELRTRDQLDEIGGPAYITYLVNNTPSSIYAEAYGRIVERAAIRRRLLGAASDIAKLAHEESADIDQVLDRSEAAIFDVTARRSRSTMLRLDQLVAVVRESIDDARVNKRTGMPTGFTDLDNLLGGLKPQDLILIAGRPSMGKTSWLINVALHTASVHKARIAIFSQEMSGEQIARSLAAIETGISTQKQESGQLSEGEYARLNEALDRLENLRVVVDDASSLTPLELLSKCRRLYQEHGLDLVIIDYIQLMVSGKNEKDRVQEITSISRNLKMLARELKVPVLAAAQLNRAVEHRQNKRPALSDLRESGALEQDADIVMFLYRDEYYNADTDRPNQADVIVAKHRRGPTGVVPLFFQKEATKFANLSRDIMDLAGF